MEKMAKKIGRPATPEYTKKKMRYSAIEKHFMSIISDMDGKERKVAEKVLEEFKKRII